MNREIINITNQSSVTIAWNATRIANFGVFPSIDVYFQENVPPPPFNTNGYSLTASTDFNSAAKSALLTGRFGNIFKVGDVLQINNAVANNGTKTVASVTPQYSLTPAKTLVTFLETISTINGITAQFVYTPGAMPQGGFAYQKQVVQPILDAPPPSTTLITFNFNSPQTGFIIIL